MLKRLAAFVRGDGHPLMPKPKPKETRSNTTGFRQVNTACDDNEVMNELGTDGHNHASAGSNASNGASHGGSAGAGNSIRSVDRALDLLTIVCSARYTEAGCTLAECAKDADLSPSTALRFLRSLTQRGFVSRDEDGMFHAGTELLRLGASVLSRSNLMRIAMPAMRSVVGDINESVYLAVRNAEGDCLYIAIEECSQAIRHVSWVGKSIPARSSAAGQVLSGTVAFGESVIERNGVEPDVTAISSPIFVAGRPVAAMSILVPSYRMDSGKTQRCEASLVKACQEVSQQLGT